jgi:feruloyl-CoA synthase
MTAHVLKTDLGSGAFMLRSPEPWQPCARCVGEWLEQWASDHGLTEGST